ncbi:MAG: DUF3253 domain-containing protein [Pseudomonadota bacterium]
MDDSDIRQAILRAVHARGPGKTLCPSEVARSLAPNWRPLMPQIRQIAQTLADGGAVIITQKGTQVNAITAKGSIRLGLPD